MKSMVWSGASIFAVLLVVALLPRDAAAWGNEGHEIIALIAEQFLEPVTRAEVSATLSVDPDSITAHDIASESVWADRYRDSDRDGARERYKRTRQWHFVDIEIDSPDLDQACFNHPRLATGVPASRGPADACIVDKIDQFAGERANPDTAPEERIVALKFLLHLVGDVHQPLHSADNHDAGGNRKPVAGGGFTGNNLHHLWDTEFVARLGRDTAGVVARLGAGISDEQLRAWSRGTADWAMESFGLARDHAYGMLPAAGADGVYVLSPAYVDTATQDVALQLSRTGVRLAFVLNRASATARQADH
jgi:S1/P1 Nuclease